MKGSVLVTGGARRIGLAICEELSARGWNVLSHSRDPENPLSSDFSRCDAAADRLFAAALEAAPDLCAIVNNAAANRESARRSQLYEARNKASAERYKLQHAFDVLTESGSHGSLNEQDREVLRAYGHEF